ACVPFLESHFVFADGKRLFDGDGLGRIGGIQYEMSCRYHNHSRAFRAVTESVAGRPGVGILACVRMGYSSVTETKEREQESAKVKNNTSISHGLSFLVIWISLPRILY
ncbi:MAG TPA: hypothetical protein VFF26_12295, partial [Gallionella sp.]|nr:hypothetical protein [Gallionella sp.]